MPKPKLKRLMKDSNSYDKDKLKAELMKIARENPDAVYINDLTNKIGMFKETFNKYFPEGSQDREDILKSLEKNVFNTKEMIRNKLLNLNQSVGLIALYRIIGTQEERENLNTGKYKAEVKTKEKDEEITLTIS